MTRKEAYTFRDAGLRPPLLRGLNIVGRGLEGIGLQPVLLAPDAIVAAAVKEAGASNLGGESYREPLERYVESVEAEGRLSTFGRLAVRGMLVKTLATRIRLHEWAREHPEIREEQVRRPWVIVGLPRTGTSLFSNLLGLDPFARPMLQWETRSPIPPPTLATGADDPRIAEYAKGIEQLVKLNPPFQSMYPLGATLSAECVPFLMLDLRTLGLETQAFVPSYGQWLQGCDMTTAYEHHRLTLQALQAALPTEAWVLKTPNHLWHLETLRAFYPDARIIWNHRDPGPVVTSIASLNNTLQRTFTDHNDPVAVGRDWRQKLRHAVVSGMRYDDEAEAGWCFHMRYSDLMRDPCAAMERVYAHFGESLGSLHERRIRAWLADRPQYVFGRHAYDPADFGWSYEEIADEFEDYRHRYDIETETR